MGRDGGTRMEYINSYYLTEPGAVEDLLSKTSLSHDEVESIVGRFKKDHWQFPSLLKGEVMIRYDGEVAIRHHFTKQIIWKTWN
jgi:hypothetical protein